MSGLLKGSVIHIHRARTVIIGTKGLVTASELGNGITNASLKYELIRCLHFLLFSTQSFRLQ